MPTINSKPGEATIGRTLENLRAFSLATARSCDTVRRTDEPPRICFSDAELEHWGRYYVANELGRTGVRFEYFMQDPELLAYELRRRVSFMPRVRAGSRAAAPDDYNPVFLRKQAD